MFRDCIEIYISIFIYLAAVVTPSRGGSLPRLFIIHKAGRFSHFIHFKLRFNAQSRSEPSVLPEIKETHFQTKVLKTEYLRRDQNRTVSRGLKHDLSDASACLYLIVSTPDGPNMFSPGTGNQFVFKHVLLCHEGPGDHLSHRWMSPEQREVSCCDKMY